METANQAASNKVFNHLMDNQTLIKEVNNLRAEVRDYIHSLLCNMCYIAFSSCKGAHIKS